MDRNETGRTLTRYKLLEEVGHGGMAVVYKGLDTTLNREVAVKVLHPHLANVEESRARLQREAHAVAKLRHENILEIFDYSGPDSPESYIVTEFIHGRTLKNFLNDHPLPFPEVAEMIASEVARALEHAHGLGVIHRDIKPENVMIRDDGMVKLMDFGIAQIVDKERMTVTGQLLGSPAYMAPEHVEGKPLDFRTDVFAVGILLYQLATGQLPFRGKNPHEVLKRIAECRYAPPDMVNPMVGARLSRVIVRALKREPVERFPDVAPLRAELLEDLEDAGVDDPRKELAKFFADPTGWAKSFKPLLVQSLAKRGRALESKGRTAAALELWSRALALEPKSSELRALVDGVARRRRAGSLAVYGGLGVVLAGAMAFGAHSWLNRPDQQGHHDHQEPPPPPVRAPIVEAMRPPAPPPLNAIIPPVKPVEDPKPIVRHAALHVPKAAPVAPAHRLVELVPVPSAVRVSLDGSDLGDYDPSHKFDLDDKPHTFAFSSPFCYPKSVTVEPGQTGKVTVRLRWKPASLLIHAKPENADVLIDGGMVATAGERIPISIPDMSEDGRREVSVKVSARGHQSRTVTVRVRANEMQEQTVTLQPVAGID